MSKSIFLSRCNNFAKKMIPNSLAIFFSSSVVLKNNYQLQHIKQSDFFYLTGLNESECILIIIKNNKNHEIVIFYKLINEKIKTWFGDNLIKQKIISNLNPNFLFPIDQFNKTINIMLKNKLNIYYVKGKCINLDNIIIYNVNKLKLSHIILDWQPIIHEMRLFKSSKEISIIKKSCNICVNAHLRAMKVCFPGMYEYQLSAEIEHEFYFQGAEFLSFITIIGSGENSCTLHYTRKKSVMQSGKLVLVDAGVSYQGYSSDITSTFPINGKFSIPQRNIYNIVLYALKTALRLYKPGISIHTVTMIILKIKIQGLINLGIIKGNVNKIIKEKSYFSFFMHKLSHWIGIDVHDVGSYGYNYNRSLEPGMVISVEPGIYISRQIKNIPEEYKGIGIRLEDNIVITSKGNKNLTSSLFRNPNTIEKFMSRKLFNEN